MEYTGIICFLILFALSGMGAYETAAAGGVVTDTTPPTINVTWPTYGETVHEPTVIIKGTAYDANSEIERVIVYNLTAHGTENWSRWGDLLVTGLNTVPITAKDAAGNEVTIHHRIYYEPTENVTTVWDDFSTDSGLWDYAGDAGRNNSTSEVLLTEAVDWQAGNLWYAPNVSGNFTAGFKFRAGGGDGADGIVFMFYKNRSYSPMGGGVLGFTEDFGTPVTGYGIEFDNFLNEMDMGDPCERHIALIKDYTDTHLAYTEDNRTEDDELHFARVEVNESGVQVEVDGDDIFSWNGSFNEAYSGFGFSGATGDDNNIHIVDDVFIIYDEDAGSESDDGSGTGSENGTDTTAPTINVTWPAYGETVHEPTVIIRGTAQDANSGVERVIVYNLTAHGTENWSRWGDLLVTGLNTVPITAKDAAGNEVTIHHRIYYEPAENLTTIWDDFSTDSGLWDYEGNASRNDSISEVLLTEAVDWQAGNLWYRPNVSGNFITGFKFRAGTKFWTGAEEENITGADGLSFMFYKDRNYTPGTGSNLGFTGVNNSSVLGYGVEFDNCYNPELGDPSECHIALIKDNVDTHLTYAEDNRTEDDELHFARTEVNESGIFVEVDGDEIFSWNGSFNNSFDGFGFSGATGVDNNVHIVDDVFIIYADEASEEADTTPPTLNVTWPAQNQTVIRSRILITGTAYDAASGIRDVMVHNLTASGTLNWSCYVNLNPGWNTIPIVTEDFAGNEERFELHVYYRPIGSWISWIHPLSEGGQLITTTELQEAIHYWINDQPVPEPAPYEGEAESWISWFDPESEEGSLITTGELQEIIYYWINELLPPKASEPGDKPPENFTNSIGGEFVLIPPGEFMMGSPYNESGRLENEGPIHKVTIEKPFYLGKYEVTQKEWTEVMGKNPSFVQGENQPVENVSWEDIQVFIQKLNEREQTDKYRLPSEAEWEYACRAGTTTAYFFGNNSSELEAYTWHEENWSSGKPHPVGQKVPNPWGLYDIYGNVWETLEDTRHDSYEGAPLNGSVWKDGDFFFRIIKGGCLYSPDWQCRSASRYVTDFCEGYGFVGFRMLREV